MVELNFDPYDATTATSTLESYMAQLRGETDWLGLREVHETTTYRTARNGRLDQHATRSSAGIMVEVLIDGQFAYAGTCDRTLSGLRAALAKAKFSATLAAQRARLFHFDESRRPQAIGTYESPRSQGPDRLSLSSLNSLLIECTDKMKISDAIVDRMASIYSTTTHSHYVNSSGSNIRQTFFFQALNLQSTAQIGSEAQTRSANGPVAICSQADVYAFDRAQLLAMSEKVAHEVMELIHAPNCPSERCDVVLAPDQMILQIHESIGHPLELDRILGDERNYAGWSFVKPEDFGKLQYGSPLMNVTFDPTVPGEFASYNFDDCGNIATKKYLIKDGVLLRGLGSLESQSRMQALFGIDEHVANFRSALWNRAPIDRMANINLEAGNSRFADMIASVEHGIYMQSNRSWSIDDYRNKFQFGCEYAQLIENGKLTKVVKNPNYRGSTTQFWNSLKAVGNAHHLESFGSPFCGKGEPSQGIRVGHRSPPCLFSNIEIFGGG